MLSLLSTVLARHIAHVRLRLNSKCDVTRLDVDCIVNPTNEALNSKHGVSFDVLAAGGEALRTELVRRQL